MAHKNRNWQRRWSVDGSQWCAIHESGLVARFQRRSDDAAKIEFEILPQVGDLAAAGERRSAGGMRRLQQEAQVLFERELAAQGLPVASAFEFVTVSGPP